VEHQLKYFASGRIELIQASTIRDDGKFLYESAVHFWESPANEMGSDKSLAKEDLDFLIKNKNEIPCKVRMTVYLSSPYYSNTMFIPAADILRVALIRQVQ
jgi:hypothetical protein